MNLNWTPKEKEKAVEFIRKIMARFDIDHDDLLTQQQRDARADARMMQEIDNKARD